MAGPAAPSGRPGRGRWLGAGLAALLLLGGSAGGAAAAPTPAGAGPRAVGPAAAGRADAGPAATPDYCGASAADLRPNAGTGSSTGSGPDAAPGTGAADPNPPQPAPGASADQPLGYAQAGQLPIGLWSAASVTLRVPAAHGTVRLALTSTGFSTDSMEVQRWSPADHRWIDLAVSGSDAEAFPTHGTFSFGYTGTADPAHPDTVPLRLQDLDRPGSLSVAASFTDGRGHSFGAPVVTSPATRPQTDVTGWPTRPALTRGGPAQALTLTVHNTTDRAYPLVTAMFYAYGMGGGHALAPHHLVLQQYLDGTGWTRLPLTASHCDPGMSATLRPTAGVPLAPGATVRFQLRLAVAATAPRAVRSAEAGLSVESGDTSLASRSLPFTVRG